MDFVQTLKLDNCNRCNGQVNLLRNARGYFQVRCSKCGKKTDWMRKTEAVICWLRGVDLHEPAYGEGIKTRSTTEIKGQTV